MELTTDHVAGQTPATILAIHGSLDASSFEALIGRARELFAAGTRRLVLDMSQLTFMGSSGLVALRSIALLMRGVRPPAPDQSWETFRELESAHEGPSAEVKLLRPHPNIQRTLEITGMDGMFEIFDDLQAAVESFG